jgi:hypothetical protein
MNWQLQSQERFVAVNILFVGLPFSVGWFYLSNEELTLDAVLLSLLLGILFGASWSWLMWRSFVIKRLRQVVEKRLSKGVEPTSKHL